MHPSPKTVANQVPARNLFPSFTFSRIHSRNVATILPMLRILIFSSLLISSACPRAMAEYVLGPDSKPKAGVPAGRVERFTFAESKVFPGTERDCWVYIPAQYDAAKPAALMVFQDGHSYVSTNGDIRVPIVFDNLIHAKEMPVTIALFVNPGHRGEGAPAASGWGPRNNRSFEYDSLGDAYATFLIDEFIPHAVKKFDLNITDDPELRGVGGQSSGGICAFTVAWERPDQFRKVLSHIGSFVNIRGGHNYPALIRKTERKPLRVFLQDGINDLNNAHGNWPLANQEMSSALLFMGYDCQFIFGEGAHSGKHGGAILPDSLRWLWRPVMENRGSASADAVTEDLAATGVDWELVGEGYQFTDAACGDVAGNFYFSDLPRAILYKVGPDGKPVAWLENAPKISGMKFGPDGRLYAATQGAGPSQKEERKRVIAIHPETKEITTVGTDVDPNDLIVSSAGWIYYTDTGKGQVMRLPIEAQSLPRPQVVAGGIIKPNGISLSADQKHLIVSEYGGTNVWRYSVAADGTLRGGERLMDMRVPQGRSDSGGDGMTTDRQSRYYITSHAGVQVFDARGKFAGVIQKPSDRASVSVAFAGPRHEWLYACASDKVFRRKTAVQGALFTGRP
jgi:gluconolactonase